MYFEDNDQGFTKIFNACINDHYTLLKLQNILNLKPGSSYQFMTREMKS